MTQPPDAPDAAVPADTDATELPEDAIDRVGVLVVVMGAKGGCGTTLVAANLAADLASERKTCLLDLDLCKGDVAGVLDLSTDRSLAPVLEHLRDVDAALLAGATQVHSSGLAVLSQPHDLTELRHVEVEEVVNLLDHVRDVYDIVVVDVGSRVDVASLTAALQADELLLITTPDVPSLRDASRVLRLLHRLDRASERIHLVVNKREPGRGIPDQQIAVQLGRRVGATIRRSDAACERADEQGRLLADVAPRAEATADLHQLWGRLHGEPEPRATRRWAWLPNSPTA